MNLDPSFASAYQKYFDAKELAFSQQNEDKPDAEQDKAWSEFRNNTNAELNALMTRQPVSPIYPWINSTRYEEDAPERKRDLCREALAIDPNFLPAYSCLAEVALLGGDVREAAQMFRRVLDHNREDAESWRHYMYLVRSDPELFRSAVDEVKRRFPHSDTAALAQYLFATAQDRPAGQIDGLKKLIAEYNIGKYKRAADAAIRLFDLEDESDPDAARELAHRCLAKMGKDEHWKAAATYADAMANAGLQLAAGRAAEALATLKAIRTDELSTGADRLEALRARALEASGDGAGAYRLLEQTFVTKPSDIAASSLYEIGQRLGKPRAEIDQEVETQRAGRAKPAKQFSLQAFTGGVTSLGDYKGRVVVLDFWFPNCGPCRASFPYVRKLIDKYKDNKDVVFLAINAVAGQEPFVMPLMHSEQINWLPLKGDIEWCTGVYGVSAFPTTFLIGRDGKVYFKPHVRNSAGERSAELAIDALLAMR
jgi:thiol-disulfide isomerase/thioredoxin